MSVKNTPGELAKMPVGRPRQANSTGSGAPQLTVRLDLQAESAIAALRAVWATVEDGPPTASHAIKRAVVETAMREAPKAYAAATAKIRARRSEDAE